MKYIVLLLIVVIMSSCASVTVTRLFSVNDEASIQRLYNCGCKIVSQGTLYNVRNITFKCRKSKALERALTP
ncbi:MAG: hypothetical protein Q7R33_08175 [Nitrosarchaeum sp.]|nr:hypothetical protein [Nitrosarchaeum sp.]